MKALLKSTKEIIDVHWNDGWIKDTEPKAWLNRNEFDILGYTDEEVQERIEQAVKTDRQEQLRKALESPGVITVTSENIDWEHRKYEIAKSAMVGILASPVIPGVDPNPSVECVARHSMLIANALIEELKKNVI